MIEAYLGDVVAAKLGVAQSSMRDAERVAHEHPDALEDSGLAIRHPAEMEPNKMKKNENQSQIRTWIDLPASVAAPARSPGQSLPAFSSESPAPVSCAS